MTARPPSPLLHEASSCSIATTVALLGDRWTLLILRDLFRGTRRFSDFQSNLGIARNLLSERLARLIDYDLVEKVLYQERPPRYEYHLTPKGADFSPVLIALMQWGDRWYANDGPPIELIHQTCGHPLEQHVTCPSCHTDLRPGQIRSRPGPGAIPEIADGHEIEE